MNLFFSRRLAVVLCSLVCSASASASAFAAVAPGAPAPAFSVQDARGATRTLSEFKGKTVVLEWTNKDCPFVKKHYGGGNMQALQKEWTGKGVVWLTVLSSKKGAQGHLAANDALAEVKRSDAAPTAVLLDDRGAMGKAFGAKTTPHMFVISGDGKVVYQGAIDSNPSADAEDIAGATNYVAAALAATTAQPPRPVRVASQAPYGCGVKY